MFTLRITDETLGFVRLIILARLLSPNHFGLMGIALVTMGTVDTFSQTGFDIALIQRKRDTDRYLDTAWTVGILRSLVLFDGRIRADAVMKPVVGSTTHSAFAISSTRSALSL